MSHVTTAKLFTFAAVLLLAAAAVAAADPPPQCLEQRADDGYGYRHLLDLAQVAGQRQLSNDDGDRIVEWQLEFFVATEQVFQLLLTSEAQWPGRAGTPYEIRKQLRNIRSSNRVE